MSVTVKFFLGANSENGFKSYFKQLQEGSLQLLILKGGHGSGKSTLIRKIAAFAEKKGHNVEFIPCASDPESLDGIIDQTAGETFIIDTTLMPLFYDGAAYSGYVSFPFAAKNTNYTVALNEVIQNSIGNVTAIATVTVKKKIGFEFKITGTYDYSKCGARINCTITFA